MTEVETTSFLRDQVYLPSPMATIIKTHNQDIESFNIEEILDLLYSAKYYFSETEQALEYFEFSEEEIKDLVLELNELTFKILLKGCFDWKYNNSTISIFPTSGPFRDILVYLYYGYGDGDGDLKTYFDKSIFKLSLRDYEELMIIFNISGPTIKEILRPVLNLNKIRLFS
jgi:hypothetical protein